MSNERYNHGNIACIDAIRAALSEEEFRGFCKGNILKYVWREAYKGGDDDLEKAMDYIMFAMGCTQDDLESFNGNDTEQNTLDDIINEFMILLRGGNNAD